MRRNGADNIGIDQQPVQRFTALLRPHTTDACHPASQPSPAQPSPAQPNPFGPLVCLLSPNCCHVLQRGGDEYSAPQTNLLCW